MVIAIIAIALACLAFFFHRHVGPALLAAIAGLSVYELFGVPATEFIVKNLSGISLNYAMYGTMVVLVLLFPLIIYIRTKDKLSGPLKIIEAILFAALVSALILPAVTSLAAFDKISLQTAAFIKPYSGFVVLGAVIVAYLDILLPHKTKS